MVNTKNLCILTSLVSLISILLLVDGLLLDSMGLTRHLTAFGIGSVITEIDG
jgi:hypothetical protein